MLGSINQAASRVAFVQNDVTQVLWYSYAGGNYSTGSNVEYTVMDSYDALGRPLIQRQLFKLNGTWSSQYQTQRSYNLAGGVVSQVYPSNRTVSYTYDSAGRTSTFTGNLGDGALCNGVLCNYATAMTYSPFGGMTNEVFGTDTTIYHKLQYNVRGQLWDTRVGTGLASNTNGNRGALQFSYIQPFSDTGNSGPNNNGNVLGAKHYRPLDEQSSTWTISTDTYSYDALNRVSSVTEEYIEKLTAGGQPSSETQQFQQSYTYDRYGNRTINPATWGTGINNKQFTVNTANNRLGVPGGQSGTMTYDSTGNLTTDTYSGAGVTRAYDAENRMTSETQANNYLAGLYTYNADGQRVRRKVNGTETWQVYGMDGELLAEYDAANASPSLPQKEYGYRNGQLLITATVNAGGWGAPPTIDDNPLKDPNNPESFKIKALHLSQLRTAINALRSHYNLPNYQWQKPAASGGAINNTVLISWEPLDEMRTALDQALGAPSPAYAGGLAPGQPILAVHIQELRNRVLNSWQSGGGGADIRWLVSDQLGTPRIVIDKTGTLANVKRHDYLPFGEELTTQGLRNTMPGYSGDNIRQKFTVKERDNETGLDYFLARYNSPLQGRFTSADPLMASARSTNPQTFNRYSYTLNNPLRYVDPTGLAEQDPTDYKPEFKPCTVGTDPSCSESQTVLAGVTIVAPREPVSTFTDINNGAQMILDTISTARSVTNQILIGSLGSEVSNGVGGAISSAQRAGNELVLGRTAGNALNSALDNPVVQLGLLAAPAIAEAVGGLSAGSRASAVPRGTKVFRVFGDEAQPFGNPQAGYFTTVNPSSISNFREASGIWPGNTGRFVLEGRLIDTSGVTRGVAAPGPGGIGGTIPQLVIVNAQQKIVVTRVSGVNPPF